MAVCEFIENKQISDSCNKNNNKKIENVKCEIFPLFLPPNPHKMTMKPHLLMSILSIFLQNMIWNTEKKALCADNTHHI